MTKSHERFFSHESSLHTPVPNMDKLNEYKQGYSELPITTTHELFAEPLVAICDYGIAGRAYYSTPNNATGQAVAGVEAIPHVRRSVAETLARLNSQLKSNEVTEFFDGNVELFVKEGLRPVWLQQLLYDEIMPRLIATQRPGMSGHEVETRRDQLIAKPSLDPLRPSPHATGGVVDLTLCYVSGNEVDMGHIDGDTIRVRPDYFEQNPPTNAVEMRNRDVRRAFYNIMTGQAFGDPTGLVVNPTEWWHYGRGDQLSEKVRGSASAYYSFAE